MYNDIFSPIFSALHLLIHANGTQIKIIQTVACVCVCVCACVKEGEDNVAVIALPTASQNKSNQNVTKQSLFPLHIYKNKEQLVLVYAAVT